MNSNLVSGIPANCEIIQGDFMELPFEDNSFDHVYTIEAVCHAPDKVKLDILSYCIVNKNRIAKNLVFLFL